MLSIRFPFFVSALFLTIPCGLRAQESDPIAAHVNKSVRPQDDFFEYANGSWFKANPIPASEQENGIFKAVQDTVDAQVARICRTSAAAKAEWGSAKQKIGDLYASGMDSVALNRDGIALLQADFAQIDAIGGATDLLRAAAYVHTVSSSPLFSIYVYQDEMQSDRNALHLEQGGLSLPDRRYYIDTDERTQTIRRRFVDYAATLFCRMGYDEARARTAAKGVLSVETQLAEHSRKREDTRDPFENYHKMSLSELNALAPNIYWRTFFTALGLTAVDSIVVGQPEYFDYLNNLLVRTPLQTWRDYLKFQLLDGLASYADDSLYMAQFEFYSRTLRGVEEPRPRWKRVVGVTNRVLGDLVGQVYVAEYLPKGTKEKFTEIGLAIKTELAARIEGLDWMGAATKQKALEKLSAVRMKLGYPDKWKDLSGLRIERNSYLRNMMNASRWATAENMQRLYKPVDRDEWHMQPQTYNAYYNPSNNEICIPGCNIIVPGFQGMPDDAVLYAIIGGSTFGHEVTHGFDDQGCLFDARGNLSNWWTEADKRQFDERTKKIVEQFDGYFVEEGLHINGSLTQGENIADLGGLIIGLQAFKKTDAYKSGRAIGGFTPLQRYFLGYAQAWMEQMRPEALATQVKSNEHAPAKWRVLGPVSNMEEFYEAFGVGQGDPMWREPAQRVKIW